MKIEIGQTVKDQITGFQGIVTGRTEYISGCKQALVQPPMKKGGEFVESRWMDEDRLTIVGAKKVTLKIENAGPDKAAPVR